MTERSSIQAAGSPSRMEEGDNDVDMKDVNATGKAGKEGEFSSSAKTPQEDKATAPIDGEKPAGSNKRKRNFKEERLAKRQRKEEIKTDKRVAAAIPEAEQAIKREQEASAKAKRRGERASAWMNEKARRREENKKREDARKQDLEVIQALEKQVKELKARILMEGAGKKGAKKNPEGPKTSEPFGEGFKSQVVQSGEDAKKVKIKGRSLNRSWKNLRKGIVVLGSLQEKVAVAKASVAVAKVGVDDDVPMEAAPKADSPEAGDAEQQNEADERGSEVAASETDLISYPSIEHLIEDSPESAIESESVPAQTESQEFDSEVPEQSSEEKVKEKVDSEIPEEENKDQEEEAEESSPAAQEKDEIEEGTPKEDAAPVVAGTEMELEEIEEEAEVNASAKKCSRKRVRSNNRLEAEETPTQPTTPASSNSQKVKTPSNTRLATTNQNFRTPSKAPAQTKAPVAKKGRPPTKSVNKATTASKSPEESVDVDAPKAKRGRVPKSRAAALASTTTSSSSGLDSPARNTRRSAKVNHS